MYSRTVVDACPYKRNGILSIMRFYRAVSIFRKNIFSPNNFHTYGKSFPQGVENFVGNSKNIDVARVFAIFSL